MSRRRGWLGAGALLLLIVAWPLAQGLDGWRASASDLPSIVVEREPFVRRVRAEGTLQAAEATTLSPPMTVRRPMRIAWMAPDGSRVQAGDVVIRFDASELESKLQEGEAARDTAAARIVAKEVREASAARNLDRDARMAGLELDYASRFPSRDPEIFSRNEIIESDLDQELARERKQHAEAVRGIRGELAEVELDLLQLERRVAEMDVRQASAELSQLEIRAPHAGIFKAQDRWGNVPEVGSMVWPGNPVAEIPRPETMEARVFVLEADAGGLAPGIEAELRLDAHPERTFRARVSKVDALAQRRHWRVPVQYFGVTLELAETLPELMKPGQRVQATLILAEESDALVVPRQSVGEVEGQTVVWVRRGDRYEPRPVELGASGLGRVVVRSGLEPGDRIALRDPRWSADDEAAEPEGTGPEAGR